MGGRRRGSWRLEVVAKRGKLVEERVLCEVRHAAAAAAVGVLAREQELVNELAHLHQALVPHGLTGTAIAPAIAPPPLRPHPRRGRTRTP